MDKQTALEHLISNSTIVENGCWLWNGSLDKDGYGYTHLDGKTIRIHRLSAYIHLDFDLASESLICHKPEICIHKNCWNPEHIYIGSHSSNEMDKRLDRVGNSAKTHCPKGHPYSPENTLHRKNGSRECRQCANERRHGKYSLTRTLRKLGITKVYNPLRDRY